MTIEKTPLQEYGESVYIARFKNAFAQGKTPVKALENMLEGLFTTRIRINER